MKVWKVAAYRQWRSTSGYHPQDLEQRDRHCTSTVSTEAQRSCIGDLKLITSQVFDETQIIALAHFLGTDTDIKTSAVSTPTERLKPKDIASHPINVPAARYQAVGCTSQPNRAVAKSLVSLGQILTRELIFRAGRSQSHAR